MASGGMDTLPHKGAVIALLAVAGLPHRTSYKDIFSVTCIKTAGFSWRSLRTISSALCNHGNAAAPA
jgi:H+/gluconate symporter-like permease